ncbi:hypothetical protein Tco_1377064 [Tanacetum coccineum]
MKRGFRGAPRPLLPAMLLVATTNPSAGQEHPDVAQSQPSSSTIPVPSTSLPPVQSPPPITAPIPASTPTPIPETDPEPMEHTFEEPSSAHQHFSPPQEHAQGQMTVDDLLQLVPQLMTKVDSLEKYLKQTKLTMGSAIMKLVKKVKKLEGLVTPSKTTINASGEEQVEDISPTTLEAAKTLSKEKEEASLAEAIRLDTLEKEEKAKQVHLDSLLAQRLAEEEELNGSANKSKKIQVQFEAQHYTDEDWDLIKQGLKLIKLSKRAKRNKPMTQSQLRTYMMNYLKNQGTWKLSQLKNLSFEEVKEEFDKLVKQSDEAKDDESTKKTGKRRKQIARKGLLLYKTDEDESEASKDTDPNSGTNIPVNPVHVAMKPLSIATYKIIKTRDELEKVCKAILDKNLQGGKPDRIADKLLK